MPQPKLLIVDDELSTSNFLKKFFERKGCTVYQAVTAQEGIELLAKERPEVVLLDIRLKAEISGIEVLKEAKDISPNSKFIVMTGSSGSKQEALKLDAYAYLNKPVDMELLIQKVSEVINLKEKV